MELIEMVEDFCRRTHSRFSVREILEQGNRNIPYEDDDGFFVLSVGHDTLSIDFLYIVPGRSKMVLERYMKIIDALAAQKNVRYIQTTARRSGLGKVLPEYMTPVAIVYEIDKGDENRGRRITRDETEPDLASAKMDR